MRALALLLGLLAQVGWGCMCREIPAACWSAEFQQVVFLGKVIRDTGPGSWVSRTALMEVREVIQGVPLGVSVVEVDADTETSCGYPLKQGKEYVIFGKQAETGGFQVKTAQCSGNFPLEGNEMRLRAMRARSSGKKGVVALKLDVRGTGRGPLPAGGIALRLKKDGKVEERVSDSEGVVWFEGLGEGVYDVEIPSPTYWKPQYMLPLLRMPWRVEVSGNRCVDFEVELRLSGKILGRVEDWLGKPVEGVTVTAGARVGWTDGSGKSGADGRFEIPGLGPGDYWVWAEQPKRERDPEWAIRYAPGVERVEEASKVIVSDDGIPRETVVRLPEPRKK